MSAPPGRPLISIVTPTLNALRYLDEYVESVLTQSYAALEIVFVDGGSTDGTLERLEEYRRLEPDRVRLVLEPHTGAGAAWNMGLRMARGEVFGCIGADDICEPGAVEAVGDFFARHPDADFVHGACDFFDTSGKVIHRHRPPSVFVFDDFVNTAREIATPSAYYRRGVMERIGWLDSSGDDFDVMLRIARSFRIHSMNRVLSRLRIRDDSAFNRSALAERLPQVRETFVISRRYGGRRWSRLAVRYYCYRVLASLRLDPLYRLLRNWRRKQTARRAAALASS